MITERNDDNRSSRGDFVDFLCSFYDLSNPSYRNYVCDSILHLFKFDEKKLANVLLKPVIIESRTLSIRALFLLSR